MPTNPIEQVLDEQKEKDEKFEERKYVFQIYQSFLDTKEAWDEPIRLLGNRTPAEFWEDSETDYAVIEAELMGEINGVEQHESTISRDKANAIFASLASRMGYPSVVAQNKQQSIDRTFGRVGEALLKWAFKQDGYPSETGLQKLTRFIHKCCVTGTAYTMDIVTKDGLESILVPNEEIFFPNLWQPDIQKQGRVFRRPLNITYSEAQSIFGHLPKWSEVPEDGSWKTDYEQEFPELKGQFEGIVEEDKCSVLYVWEKVMGEELKKYRRKVSKNAKYTWKYNVIVNGVLMYEKDNIIPYKSGILPISKMVFEYFAKTEFALGNSVPNKCRQDKKWKDGWKTNLRFRSKLAGLPPQLVFGGLELDVNDVMIPGQFTKISDPSVKVEQVPGIVAPSNVDFMLMNMADTEIDRGTVSPSSMGQRPDQKQTARAEVIQAEAAKDMMQPFAQQLMFSQIARSFHIILALFEKLPKSSIKKIAIPDQTLNDGLTGTLEVIFKEEDEILAELDQDEIDSATKAYEGNDPRNIKRLLASMKIQNEEKKSRTAKNPKDIVYIAPSFLDDIKFYLYADVNSIFSDNDEIYKQRFNTELMPIMLQDPQFNRQEVYREWMRINDINERLLATQQAPQMAQSPSLPPTNKQSAPTNQTDMASRSTTGSAMPSLPV